MKITKIILMLSLFLMAGVSTTYAQTKCKPADCVRKCQPVDCAKKCQPADCKTKTATTKATKTSLSFMANSLNILPEFLANCCKKQAKTTAVKVAQNTKKQPCCEPAMRCKKGKSKVALIQN